MSKHMKRLNAPRALRIHRKEKKWTVKPSPGPHPIEKSIPLSLIIRDVLDLADTRRETKIIISNGEILVDGAVKKDYKHPVGLMDVISIPKLKKDYRVLFDRKGKLTLTEISSKDANWKLYRIQNKKVLKKNKKQLNLHDGANKIVDKDEYNTGDVLKIDLKNKKILDRYEFKKGSVSMITGGSHIGEIATIEKTDVISSSKSNISIMKGENEFTTLQEYVFPIGKNNPTIKLPEVKMQ